MSASYTYQKTENTKDWLFDQAVFSGIIPFVEDGETYNLFQNTTSTTNHAKFRLKHYWVLNNFNHIYPVVGTIFHNQTYGTLDYQILKDGSTNGFQNSGFNNDLNYRIVDTYFGFEYKRKLGELILKPGLVYHYFLWNIEQFGTEITNQTKAVLLPKISAKLALSSGENFNFDYSMQTSFSGISSYANRLRLASFNQLYRGNENLENKLYHQLSFRFYQFNLFKGNFVSAGLNYTKRVKSVQNTTILNGIDQISTPTYTKLPQNSFSMNGSYSKRIGKLKFSLSGDASWSNYSRIINEVQIDYRSENYSYSFKTETDFKSWPNVEVGLTQNFSIFQSENRKNEFMNLTPYAFLEYDFDDFIFKTNYSYNYYENKNTGQINRFQIGDASLYYGKADSLWGFELSVKNLFDVRYKNQNSFSQFLVTDRNTYIQPRTILFKISYKL